GGAALAAPGDDPTTTPAPDVSSPVLPAEPSEGVDETRDQDIGLSGNPVVELSRSQGNPGTTFTATATGFVTCGSTMSFQWSGGAYREVLTVAGIAMALLTVSDDTPAGAYVVTASCGDELARDTFTVTVPERNPTLDFTPDRGEPGTAFTATARGFGQCDPMSFRWGDDSQPLATVSDAPDPVTVDLVVPEDAKEQTSAVTASCGDTQASSPFTVTVAETPSVTVNPVEGRPGTAFTATATGFGTCRPVSFEWDGAPLGPATDENGTLTGQFTVPEAPARAHQVTASCADAHAPPATFTVAQRPTPVLTLSPATAAAGTEVRASGTGFDCQDDRVQLLWDGTSLLTDAPAGTFTVTLAVPAQAPAQRHTVLAVCRDHPDVSDSLSFTVTPLAPPITTPVLSAPATLALTPSSGQPDDRVQVVGDRFGCTNVFGTVQLWWEDGTQLPVATLDRSGHFTTSVAVPLNAPAGPLRLHATCLGASIPMTADFTVVADPIPELPPRNGIPWWVIVLIGVTAGGASLLVVRRLRKSKPSPRPAPVVRAVPRVGPPPAVDVFATPANGEATHTVLLEIHADPGTQMIREVDDDHART
ncbi:MAG: hypothetical protein ABWY93_08520, partial [Mycobacterium sp.]